MNENLFSNYDFVVSIIENSYDGVYITDRNGMTLYANSAYEKLTGNSRDVYVGKTMDELMESGIMTTHITPKVVETKNTVTATEKLPSGKEVIITGNPILDDDGEVLAVVTNLRDISEIIELEDEARRNNELINIYKNRYLGELAINNDIVCKSPSTVNLFNLATKVASKDSTVILTGETGTGKEIVAKYIHNNSERKSKNYVKINCGAIPENLLESELFGYVGGAFTGADPKGKAGMFELAHNGTLFLDEIGELPIELQPALLRALQDGEITRVGSTKTIKVDVRIIAATNRDLPKMLKEGTFREDLYYRLNVISLKVPPLRERREDIPGLVDLLINRLNEKYGEDKHATSSFVFQLMSMEWPGNIRELFNFVERQFILNESSALSSIEHLDFDSYGAGGGVDDNFNMDKIVCSVEASLMKSALEKSRNTKEASALLGISQPTFSRKYNKYKDMGLI
ncbi:MAG: sigma 54-interacting transcriptional regulator [Eubacterium sp.]|nr:sigma 54-interacting transcriptional regulator [Candidatus Colimonas fimequi]